MKCSRVEPPIVQVFFVTTDRRKVIRGLSSPVTHSHPESRLTPSVVVKGSAANDGVGLRSTPSLPWNGLGNWSQPTATVFAG
jgi:hypothetical protein